MFEKFSAQARETVHAAVSQAQASGSSTIDCDHLLIGLAGTDSGPAADALSAAGLTSARLRELAATSQRPESLDAESLALIGIDLDAVRRAAENAFGPGALDRPSRSRPARTMRARLTPEARKAIELASRSTHRNRDRAVSSGHLLIGLIDQGDNAATKLLAAADIDRAELRSNTLRRMTAAGVTAAGVTAAGVTAAGVTAAGVTAAGVTAAG